MRRLANAAVTGAIWALTLLTAWLADPGALSSQGRMRQLYCRGKPGIDLRVDGVPSSRDPRPQMAGMVLKYEPASPPTGKDPKNIEPGTCTWNPNGWPNEPREPGVVYFDILRQAQPWTATGTRKMDTTINAAVFLTDTISLPRYLGDPGKYWHFFVNDTTHISLSFGAYEPGVTQPTYVEVTGSVVREPRPAAATRFAGLKEFRCRGGASGLSFARGAAAGSSGGTSLVTMTLAYALSRNVPGETGRGLDPGTCAWVDRTNVREEPGRVDFTTPGNAQLRQIQSGGVVDRSPTAAERWPDANTIPAYMTDPNHFWSFTVDLAAPTVATAHAAWKLDVTDIVTAKPPSTQPTTRSQPGAFGDRYTPGSGRATTRTPEVFDIRNVQVTAGLEGAVIRFDAAPNSTPTVWINTTPPIGKPGGYNFSYSPVQIPVSGGTPNGTMWRYAAASSTPLGRNTRYWFIISANQTGNARYNQATGEFKTLGQRVTIAFSQIYVISDGDESDQEFDGLRFKFEACPQGALTSAVVDDPRYGFLDWGEGPHRLYDIQMASTTDATPDRLRVLILGIDRDGLSYGTDSYPSAFCKTPDQDIVPGKSRLQHYEWNSIVRDIDLTKYPGTKAAEQFVWRSKPIRNGSTLMFEVRGSIQVTRQ